MIKQNKRKSTKKCSNLISNIQSLTFNNHRGITLIALIITIIVMLILVGVSVTMAIKGDLFGITKRAAKRTEKEKNAEQEFANGRIKIDNTWYDSLEDYVEGNPSKDQKESNIKFAYEPKGWTKGPVKVKIEAEGIEGTLQYSMDGVTWENYTEEIEVTNYRTKIYAKVMGSEEEAETVVETIDKEAPEITTALNSPSQTTTSINLEIGVTDSLSGISEIKWYYKKEEESEYIPITDTDTEISKTEAGNITKVLQELTPLATYNIYAEIYDVAGNSTRSPETNTIDIKATDPLLGKSATINGQKYIVLYINGEQGDEVQLISANVLEVDSVSLGYEDGQVNWTNSDVIAEANLDNNDTLDNDEKAIYSYNHMLETLNKKCEDLVGKTNTDIVSVRSVGSNPTNPNNDTSTYCTSDYLKDVPDSARKKYYGKGKNIDNNYLTDYFRMKGLGIINAENDKAYWLASRYGTYMTRLNTFCVRFITEGDILPTYESLLLVGAIAVPYGKSYGVRPVISLEIDALSEYLDK